MPRPPVLVGSHMRVNLVTEAQSVLPSLTSAFSIESMVERQPYYMAPQSEVLRRRVLPDLNDDYYRDVTSSCQNFDDPYENPTYTDTVKSTDSTGSALRRSISVPPEYTFKTSAANSRRHAREVFEEYFKMLENENNDNQNSNQDIEGALEADEESDIVASQSADGAAGGGSGVGKKWRQTMTDLLENPEYVDSIESTSSGAVLLARSAASLGNKHGGEIVSTALVPRVPRVPEEGEHLKYVKNLVILSFSFFFIFGPYLSVRNLQSSIIEDSTLAFFALSTIYASLFVGCIFATTIVQRLRPKRTMLLCMCSYVFYVAANYYPHYYTLVPAAFAVGFCMGNLWTAQATYLTNIAACYAETTGKTLRNVVSKFNGMFFGIFGVSQIVGGIISSTVLMNQHVTTDLVYTWPNIQNVSNATHDSTEYLMYNPDTDSVYADDSYAAPAGGDDLGGISKSNATFPAPQVECGAEFCNSRQKPVTSSPVDTHVLYILLAIYGGLMLVGILITLCFLDPLEGVMARSHDSFCDQMTAVFKWFVDYRVACLAGIGFYSLISMSFMFGEFYKVTSHIFRV